QGDMPGARVLVEELLKSNITADVRVVGLLMETYARQNEIGKGLDRLKEIAAAYPNSAPIQQLLGQWHQRAGNLAESQKAFGREKAPDPNSAAADLSLAELDLREGRNDEARQKLTSVLAAAPTNVPALLLAARADDATGDHAAAVARYRAVLGVDGANLV